MAAFAGYTVLGYLALAIHRWVFVPEISPFSSGLQFALVFGNLTAGGWCFLKALLSVWPLAR